MAGSRYSLIQKTFWQYLGPAYRGLDADLDAVETAVAAGGSGGGGTDVTVRQNANGTWPTITRGPGLHYRWLCVYDTTKWPTSANGAAAGDELVGPDETVVPA